MNKAGELGNKGGERRLSELPAFYKSITNKNGGYL